MQHRNFGVRYCRPTPVFIESQAAYKIDRFNLGESIVKTSNGKYNNLIENYREWGNARIRSVFSGKVSSVERALMEKIESIKSVVNSEENELLLEYSV